MLRREGRFALQIGVLVAAALSAAFVAREAWRRRAAAPAERPFGLVEPSPVSSAGAPPPLAERPPLPPMTPEASPAVSEGIPLKVDRVERPKPRRTVPPPPR